MKPTMKGVPTRESLLRLLILILTAMDHQVLAAHHHGGHHRHQPPKRIPLQQAVSATRTFPCREPQLRSYYLRDLMQYHQSESAIQPVYIMQKRCDSHSGCCFSPDLSCVPLQSTIYHEDIQVEVWSLETNSTRWVWIRIEQHRNCSCELSNQSKRRKADLPPSIQVL